MNKLLEGKCAVVAGGGRGIGRAIALALAHHGANVVVNDYGTELNGSNPSPAAADTVVKEIRENGGTAVSCFASVADFEASKSIISTCIENFDKIDILVNCATIARGGQIWETSEEDSDAVMSVTLKGTLNTCTHALVVMREQGTGRIINFSSPSWLGVTGADTYTASKGAVVSLTRGIASRMKLEGYRITCNAIAPVARTRLNTSVPEMWVPLYEAGIINRQLYEDSANPPSPEEIAPIVCYLATDQAENVSGKVFGASRGRVALYSEPAEIKGIYKEGIWTLEELMTLFPKSLGQDL
ncbi:MAG: SDR family oxidoreductase [Dehalococcoidales bacterium]|nr:SDR family oxidoreductase [Dehalococcoidales bacterium]